LLTPFKETEEYGPAYTEPLPEIIDDKEEYELEEVLASKHTPQGKLVYRVHWKGYPSSEDSWVRPADMTGAQEAIEDFHHKYPNAVDKDRPTKT
jgi:hypothetical protein